MSQSKKMSNDRLIIYFGSYILERDLSEDTSRRTLPTRWKNSKELDDKKDEGSMTIRSGISSLI